jgi:acetylglutamate kinase
MTEAKIIDLDKQAAKIARDIKANLFNNDRGIWNSEAAKKRHERLTKQLEKIDELIGD